MKTKQRKLQCHARKYSSLLPLSLQDQQVKTPDWECVQSARLAWFRLLVKRTGVEKLARENWHGKADISDDGMIDRLVIESVSRVGRTDIPEIADHIVEAVENNRMCFLKKLFMTASRRVQTESKLEGFLILLWVSWPGERTRHHNRFPPLCHWTDAAIAQLFRKLFKVSTSDEAVRKTRQRLGLKKSKSILVR